MAAPAEYRDVTADPTDHTTHQHHTSPQPGLEHNPDPALLPTNEHHHAHLHHGAAATKGRENEPVYSKNTTDEPRTIPHQDAMDHVLHRRHKPEEAGVGAYGSGKEGVQVQEQDAEKGNGLSPVQSEEDPRNHRLSGWYARWRPAVHALIWLLFTA